MQRVTTFLASGSPSKLQVLRSLGIGFYVDPADVDEDAIARRQSEPGALVETLALEKARAVAERHPEAVVIGADTVVLGPNGIIGKPRNSAHAQEILSALSGSTHHVHSGIAIVDSLAQQERALQEVTRVRFRDLSQDDIRRYVASGEPLGKAGAYAIQGRGALLVQEIHGDYNSIRGFPTNAFSRALDDLGFDLL